MRRAIIIPARWESSRFPGKPLADIAGKPLIQWTWQQAQRAGYPVIIATDSNRVADACFGFGADVAMTGDCRNGTERCAEAAEARNIQHVINWQGDAPAIPHWWADALFGELGHGEIAATPACLMPAHDGLVRAQTGDDHRAKSFERINAGAKGRYLMHIGMYAYSDEALRYYCAQPESEAEMLIGLEQIRWGPGVLSLVILPAPRGGLRECNYPADVDFLAALLPALEQL